MLTDTKAAGKKGYLSPPSSWGGLFLGLQQLFFEN